MITSNLGYPRIGNKRQLKKACEEYWAQRISTSELLNTAQQIKAQNWKIQQDQGIELIPSNDFSFYDQVLDHSLMFSCIPQRFEPLNSLKDLDLYFAMARGYQQNNLDITAMEMTKWFDTNYHYIVPEFKKDQTFKVRSKKVVEDFKEALDQGILTRPVLISPVTYLWLGKEKEEGFHRIQLLDRLVPVYFELIQELVDLGAQHLQLDDPILALDLEDSIQQGIVQFYTQLAQRFPELKIFVASYFDGYGDNLDTLLSLPVHAFHLDLVRAPLELNRILKSNKLRSDVHLSLGVVDGRNIWKNNFQASLQFISKAQRHVGADRLYIAPSCALLHSPVDLDLEQHHSHLSDEVKFWLAFAKQKLEELSVLKSLAVSEPSEEASKKLDENKKFIIARQQSTLTSNVEVQQRVSARKKSDASRTATFNTRKKVQAETLQLVTFPTTTIGSFPQTKEVRRLRAQLKKRAISLQDYEQAIEEEIIKALRIQEDIGLDVLVHGEFERNDMVEYFGERLEGFAFTQYGWVQSYGSRCVKPPIIYGDVVRKHDMTVRWSAFAQSQTDNFVKGMLTGPVTMLQWSFVRDDQPRKDTCLQIAYAIRDEVVALEQNGIKVIQIDEPAIREGLPLKKAQWEDYLDWAVESFKIASCGVKDDTQIHTHMCYSEFNDIIESIAALDADVITIETSRSQLHLLDAFVNFKYPNQIGPGVYDIHSPRVPTVEEMEQLIQKTVDLFPKEHIWVNPDCGLKTRGWPETQQALKNMVQASINIRQRYS